jgi:CMP-N-acetylneuraminic acid synthetase
VQEATSLGAMSVVTEHPCKMWRTLNSGYAESYVSQNGRKIPTHDSATQSLEKLLVQNASLEITTSRNILQSHSISGPRVVLFQLTWYEFFDLNSEEDWSFLEYLVGRGISKLPSLKQNKFGSQ